MLTKVSAIQANVHLQWQRDMEHKMKGLAYRWKSCRWLITRRLWERNDLYLRCDMLLLQYSYIKMLTENLRITGSFRRALNLFIYCIKICFICISETGNLPGLFLNQRRVSQRSACKWNSTCCNKHNHQCFSLSARDIKCTSLWSGRSWIIKLYALLRKALSFVIFGKDKHL